MIRTVGNLVVAFDCEWIPDPNAARLLFPEATALNDARARDVLWAANGATEAEPHPFVRLMQSRVVSIAMVRRAAPKNPGEAPTLELIWLPGDPENPRSRQEANIISPFLTAIGKRSPQLVGFNSKHSDLRILAQRAVALGIPAKGFLHRPPKPWEGSDYFARDNDCSVDLMELLTAGGSGRAGAVSLHEAAALSGIPGKFDTHGDAVLDLWLAGRFRDIVEYNCFDALTTYLLWLRMAWVSGHFANDEYEQEQECLRQMLMHQVEEKGLDFLERYLNEWDRLTSLKERLSALAAAEGRPTLPTQPKGTPA